MSKPLLGDRKESLAPNVGLEEPSCLETSNMEGYLPRSRHALVFVLCELTLPVFTWILVAISSGFQPHHHRYIISLTDPALNYPWQTSTVSVTLLGILSLLVPIILIILALLWRSYRNLCRALFDMFVSLSAVFTATGLATLITQILKLFVGRPRPNFIEYCGYNGVECVRNASDAWQSFPSGHSSFSFSGLTFLTLFFFSLLPKLAHDRKHNTGIQNGALDEIKIDKSAPDSNTPLTPSKQPKSAFLPPHAFQVLAQAWLKVFCAAPLILATWIAVTRITDYWHNFDDVIAGSAIGIFSAWFVAYLKLPLLHLKSAFRKTH